MSEARPSPNLRQRLWTTVKVAAALALLVFVISRTSLQQVRQAWGSISVGWLLLSIGCFLLMTLVKALQYRALINPELPYRQVLGTVAMQNAISNYFSNTAGVAAYLALFKADHEVSVKRSAAAFILVKVGDLASILVLLTVSMGLTWQQTFPLHPFLVLASLVLLGLLGAILAAVFLRQTFVAIVSGILSRLKLTRFKVVQAGLDLLEALSQMPAEQVKGLLRRSFAYSALYFGCTLLWAITLTRAFRIPVGVAAITFIMAVYQVISFIPVQVFGGLGVSEVTSLYLYGLFGVPQAGVAAALLGMRLYNLLVNALPLVFIPFGRGKAGKPG